MNVFNSLIITLGFLSSKYTFFCEILMGGVPCSTSVASQTLRLILFVFGAVIETSLGNACHIWTSPVVWMCSRDKVELLQELTRLLLETKMRGGAPISSWATVLLVGNGGEWRKWGGIPKSKLRMAGRFFYPPPQFSHPSFSTWVNTNYFLK